MMTANPILLQKKYARVIECFAKQQGLSLDEALGLFYHSEVYQLMRDGVSDMHCMSDAYLAEELEDEAAISFEKAIEINPNIEMWYMIASAYSESDYLIEAKEYFEKVYQINPKYEDVTEKLSVLCLMHGEIDNFFKYNKECEHPLEEDMILDLLNSPEHREEDERTLKKVWERMKKENKKKTKGKK